MEITINKVTIHKYFDNVNIKFEYSEITGFIGKNYNKLLDEIVYNNIKFNIKDLNQIKNNYFGYINKNLDFFTNNVYDEILLYINRAVVTIKDVDKRIDKVLKMFLIDKEILNKKISELSNGEKRMLKYIITVIYNPNIIFIDEPYLYLDFNHKKIINNVLYELKNKYNKTIVIGSNNSNIIYSLCDKVLLVSNNKTLYGNKHDIFRVNNLNKYHIEIPDLMKFSLLAKKKNKDINYFTDIRDLIKEVYRNV